ncbi:uncharacterized protein EI97DRAFT_464843 [Westerdykella ornata]|uniref:Mid2 domain-containing protein n=1 Tax=Westerdykella ornata TaxID=318751 RepID=A0A6A6JST8_WESOR|nr:uncharacterized protein EI97DRAFT_464843 [Westerdykella ornata]KAF2279622.1 hypothetical protein EI97DRAFT_464843 [Westerdykella ornata]
MPRRPPPLTTTVAATATSTLTLLLALLPLPLHAAIEEFHYASNATGFKCPDMPFECEPPKVCSRDTLLNKYYCCDPGKGGVCWTGSETCSGQGGKAPGGSQTGCEMNDGNVFCCLAKREECTQVRGQINICWAPENPISNFSAAVMNDTFSSLSAAAPSATTWEFNLQSLLAPSSTSVASSAASPTAATATATLSTASTSGNAQGTATPSPPTSAQSNPAPEPTTPSSPSSSSSLSAGAIAGIAIGAVAAVSILIAGIFLLWRRERSGNGKAVELDAQNPYTDNGGGGGAERTEKYAYYQGQEMEVTSPRVELDGGSSERAELEGDGGKK